MCVTSALSYSVPARPARYLAHKHRTLYIRPGAADKGNELAAGSRYSFPGCPFQRRYRTDFPNRQLTLSSSTTTTKRANKPRARLQSVKLRLKYLQAAQAAKHHGDTANYWAVWCGRSIVVYMAPEKEKEYLCATAALICGSPSTPTPGAYIR